MNNGSTSSTQVEINGVSLFTKSGKAKSRFTNEERLKLIGATKYDLTCFILLFCPDRPLYAQTRRGSPDPRAWYTPRGRLEDGSVLKHLVGNIIPNVNPVWIAPRSWEVTRWIGIDVDLRGDKKDFKRRKRQVVKVLKRLGIQGKAILYSRTPSGGAHYRFFLTDRIRVSDVRPVMAAAGLRDCPGEIEIFPRMDRGMRLPFGYVPGLTHHPRRFVRFIREYRRGYIPLVDFYKLKNRANRIAQKAQSSGPKPKLASATRTLPVEEGPTRAPYATSTLLKKIDSARRSPFAKELKNMATSSLSMSLRTAGQTASSQSNKFLLSKKATSIDDINSLWRNGIQEKGQRLEITKRLAANMLFIRRIDPRVVADELVRFVYQSGRITSTDVAQDLSRGTRAVEAQTRKLVAKMASYRKPTEVLEIPKSKGLISKQERRAILDYLKNCHSKSTIAIVALHILRYAKLHGISNGSQWHVPLAIRGVVRKWPGCARMGYKPILDFLISVGFMTKVREKIQTANKTGCPRVYAINVSPSLSDEAGDSIERSIAKLTRYWKKLGRTSFESHYSPQKKAAKMDTYKMDIPSNSEQSYELGDKEVELEPNSTTIHASLPQGQKDLAEPGHLDEPSDCKPIRNTSFQRTVKSTNDASLQNNRGSLQRMVANYNSRIDRGVTRISRHSFGEVTNAPSSQCGDTSCAIRFVTHVTGIVPFGRAGDESSPRRGCIGTAAYHSNLIPSMMCPRTSTRFLVIPARAPPSLGGTRFARSDTIRTPLGFTVGDSSWLFTET